MHGLMQLGGYVFCRCLLGCLLAFTVGTACTCGAAGVYQATYLSKRAEIGETVITVGYVMWLLVCNFHTGRFQGFLDDQSPAAFSLFQCADESVCPSLYCLCQPWLRHAYLLLVHGNPTYSTPLHSNDTAALHLHIFAWTLCDTNCDLCCLIKEQLPLPWGFIFVSIFMVTSCELLLWQAHTVTAHISQTATCHGRKPC